MSKRNSDRRGDPIAQLSVYHACLWRDCTEENKDLIARLMCRLAQPDRPREVLKSADDMKIIIAAFEVDCNLLLEKAAKKASTTEECQFLLEEMQRLNRLLIRIPLMVHRMHKLTRQRLLKLEKQSKTTTTTTTSQQISPPVPQAPPPVQQTPLPAPLPSAPIKQEELEMFNDCDFQTDFFETEGSVAGSADGYGFDPNLIY